MFPMAVHVLPMRAHLIPSIGNPVSAAALEYIAPRNPRIGMTVPVPVARRPDVAVTRRGSPFLPWRRGCRIGIDAGSGGSGSAHCAGAEAQRDQDCFAHGVHIPSLLCMGMPLTTPTCVSKTSTMPTVKQKLHRPVQS